VCSCSAPSTPCDATASRAHTSPATAPQDIRAIRKRSFLRLPNTIAIERADSHAPGGPAAAAPSARGGGGCTTTEVFTSFVFSTRRRAFDTLVARWRDVK
jgi:hypothetical protein